MSNGWFCIDCRVAMAWHEDGYQKCPVCGIEVWYPDGDKRPQEAAVQLLNGRRGNEYLSRAQVPGTGEPGGSDPVGKSKTEKMKAPSCLRIYQQLYKET